MNKEEFKRYQTKLNHRRENELKSTPKLAPTVLLGDEDFDLTLEDISLTVSLPHLETSKPETCVSNQQTSNALF